MSRRNEITLEKTRPVRFFKTLAEMIVMDIAQHPILSYLKIN